LNNSKKITFIKSKRSWWDLNLLEIIKYKGLIYFLIRRDFVASYKQTILGPTWVVLQALMGSAIFSVIFGNIAGLSTDGHPAFLFYLCGSLAWQYFGTTFGAGCGSLQTHLALFSKVYFPRLIPPLCDVISALINFCIHLIVLGIALIIYNQQYPGSTTSPSMWVLLLPLLILQSAMLGLGLGFLISSASVKYRDLSRIAGLSTQFLMYASPIIYPISEVPIKYQAFLAYNPLTFIVESYRFLLLGHSTACTFKYALPSITITLLLFFLGILTYNKTQCRYVDYV
jgi:lipopolysaccharide transport system permease protein